MVTKYLLWFLLSVAFFGGLFCCFIGAVEYIAAREVGHDAGQIKGLIGIGIGAFSSFISVWSV